MIRVYEYGCLAPTLNGDKVEEQTRLAHRYRNKLVEIDRSRRAQVRKAVANHPVMMPLEEELGKAQIAHEEAKAQLLAARKATRSRSEAVEVREKVRELGKVVREIKAQIKAARPQANIDLKPEYEAADEIAEKAVKTERDKSGVYWGTYMLVEADWKRAKKGKMPPKFKRWQPGGRVSVQLQNGIKTDQLLKNTQLQIVPAAPDTPEQLARRLAHAKRCGTIYNPEKRVEVGPDTIPLTKKAGTAVRKVLRLRIGSDERSKPIWAEWPMTMHRPLPVAKSGEEPTKIKTATVARWKRNCRQDYVRVMITVEAPPSAFRKVPADGAVALNVGYCKRPDGQIRAGYLVGSDGYQEEVLIPADIPDALAKADSLRSIRDRNMDEMRAHFLVWRATLQEGHDKLVAMIAADSAEFVDPFVECFRRLAEYVRRGGLPGVLAQRFRYVHAWRSAERFRSLAYLWRKHRFDGDTEGYKLLEAWRYRDEHLECYESGVRRKALLRRREAYRVLAARLAIKYRDLVIDDTDLAELQRSPAAESEDVDIPAVKSNQRIAAGSELRKVLMNPFVGHVFKHDAADKTRKCHACGEINEWDRLVEEREHTCSGCGKRWDQDANFGLNLLREHAIDLVNGGACRIVPKVTIPLSTRMKMKRDAAKAAAAEVAMQI